MMKGLQQKGVITQQQISTSNNQLPAELARESIPFSIRKAKPFMIHLQ